MFEEFLLPDGTVATSSSDIDRYLKTSGAAYAGDYSAEYLQGIRHKTEKAQRAEMLSDFVQLYKKRIWNE
jgi:hypothetical protein